MSLRSVARLSIVIGLLLLLSALPAAIALGHAELDTATPKDKATVNGPLAEVVMTFTEPVKPANSSLKLVDSGGKVVVEGSTVDASDAKTMHLALPATLPAGTYTVRWTTASALDGDLDHGTTTFTLNAAPSVAPSAPPTTLPSEAAASPSTAASVAPSVAPSPSPSSPPTSPATSTSDAVIPVVVALIVLAGLGLWLLRGRSRSVR